MKRALFVLSLITLGAAVGAIGTWYYIGFMVKRGVALIQDAQSSAPYNYAREELEKQFNNPNRDVAIYALTLAAANLERFPRRRHSDCREAAYTLAKVRVRLAQLHKAAGNPLAEKEQLQSAITHFASMGWHLQSIAELESVIPLIEAGNAVEAMKTVGKMGNSCE